MLQGKYLSRRRKLPAYWVRMAGEQLEEGGASPKQRKLLPEHVSKWTLPTIINSTFDHWQNPLGLSDNAVHTPLKRASCAGFHANTAEVCGRGSQSLKFSLDSNSGTHSHNIKHVNSPVSHKSLLFNVTLTEGTNWTWTTVLFWIKTSRWSQSTHQISQKAICVF